MPAITVGKQEFKWDWTNPEPLSDAHNAAWAELIGTRPPESDTRTGLQRTTHRAELVTLANQALSIIEETPLKLYGLSPTSGKDPYIQTQLAKIEFIKGLSKLEKESFADFKQAEEEPKLYGADKLGEDEGFTPFYTRMMLATGLGMNKFDRENYFAPMEILDPNDPQAAQEMKSRLETLTPIIKQFRQILLDDRVAAFNTVQKDARGRPNLDQFEAMMQRVDEEETAHSAENTVSGSSGGVKTAQLRF